MVIRDYDDEVEGGEVGGGGPWRIILADDPELLKPVRRLIFEFW